MRVAKVIATTFAPRSVREKTGLCGKPLGYFSHSQNFPTRESIIDLINFTIEAESRCNPGEPVDLIIVNGDTGWRPGNDFLDSLNGKQLKHGKIHVLHRPPIGLSYGGYSHAFKMLGGNYDYFIFTEDDAIIARDGYAAIGIEVFNNTEKCGFVAYQCISSIALDLDPEDALAAHCGCGLTSADVLNDVVRQYGSLPHSRVPSSSSDRAEQIRNGEVAFTNKIYKLGYKLVSIPDDIKLYDFAYDLMRGLDVRRFPTLPEKLINISKRAAYKYAFVRAIHNLTKAKRNQLLAK